MNISLKSIKILKHASEESTCYEAVVYVDNKKAGIASNDGHGGMTMVRLNPPYHETFKDKMFDTPCFCRGTKKECMLCNGSGKQDVPLDEYIDYLMTEAQTAKDLARMKKKGSTVAIFTFDNIYGMSTRSTDEALIRKAFTVQSKETIREIRFL